MSANEPTPPTGDTTRLDPQEDPLKAPPPVVPVNPDGGPTIEPLIRRAVMLTLGLVSVAGISLQFFHPNLAPWYVGTCLLVLANAAIWRWIILGAFRVQGTPRYILLRGLVAKSLMLILLVYLALTLRITQESVKQALLAGLFTPLIGLVLAAIFPPAPQRLNPQ